MDLIEKLMLKRLVLTVVGSLFISYGIVVVFLMFGPLYIGGELAIKQSGKFTLILAPFVGAVLYIWLLRRDRRRKVHGT